jgi:RNA polymerase primary sigma factor
MAKTTSGKKATERGSSESKRAVAHSRSASSSGVSETSVNTVAAAGAKRKTLAASAASAGRLGYAT